MSYLNIYFAGWLDSLMYWLNEEGIIRFRFDMISWT